MTVTGIYDSSHGLDEQSLTKQQLFVLSVTTMSKYTFIVLSLLSVVQYQCVMNSYANNKGHTDYVKMT